MFSYIENCIVFLDWNFALEKMKFATKITSCCLKHDLSSIRVGYTKFGFITQPNSRLFVGYDFVINTMLAS